MIWFGITPLLYPQGVQASFSERGLDKLDSNPEYISIVSVYHQKQQSIKVKEHVRFAAMESQTENSTINQNIL
jgi:hypothetical protein